MIHLVYVSSGTREFTHRDLVALLEQSRRRNLRQDVTGMLLYAGGNFIQVLEGLASDVDEIYASIEKDERNTGNVLLKRERIPERSFPDWSMGFNWLSDQAVKYTPGFSDFLNRKMTATELHQADIALELLYQFKEFNLQISTTPKRVNY